MGRSPFAPYVASATWFTIAYSNPLPYRNPERISPHMRKAPIAVAAMLALPLLSTAASATDIGAVEQLTDGDAKSTVPSIDGAGDTIVFHSATALDGGTDNGLAGADEGYVSDDAGAITRLATDGMFLSISPNGDWVVYTDFSDNTVSSKVVRVRSDGSDEVVVAAGNANSGTNANEIGVAVADDGTVVFQSLATDLVTGDTDDGKWDVYSYSTAGDITKLSGGDDVDYLYPDISANGSLVTYHTESRDADNDVTDRTVYSNTVAGGEENVLAAGNGFSDSARISDDGSKVVFRSDSTDLTTATLPNTTNVYLWSNAGIIAVTQDNDGVSLVHPDISGDGNFVVYRKGVNIWRNPTTAGSAAVKLSDDAPGPIDYATANSDGSIVAWAESTDDSVAGVEIMLWKEEEDPVDPVDPGDGNGGGDGGDGEDEYCDFADPIMVNAPYAGMSGEDARIARLYGAFFLREPDANGFAFWQGVIASGNWTNEAAATFFGESPEFKDLYGDNLSNGEWLTQIYGNVMCRKPDAGGFAFWMNKLDNEGWSRGKVALFFSDSKEFRDRTKTT